MDANDFFDHADIDMLSRMIRGWPIPTGWLPDAAFDLDSDGSLSTADHHVWVKEIKHTWFGDANLDGQFNSADLVAVFQAGQYEDAVDGNSTWASGDWNADGDFTSGDLVVAMADGGYEAGPRVAVVPEPAGVVLVTAAAAFVVLRWRRCADTRPE